LLYQRDLNIATYIYSNSSSDLLKDTLVYVPKALYSRTPGRKTLSSNLLLKETQVKRITLFVLQSKTIIF